MSKELSSQVYIPSMEASTIYTHIKRNGKLYPKYVGMIPKSLELESLVKHGMKPVTNKRNKRKSNALINVQFKTKVRDSAGLIKTFKNKITSSQAQINKIEEMKADSTKKKDIERLNDKILKKQAYIHMLENAIDEANRNDWEEVNSKELRKELYTNGFTLKFTNYNTGEIVEEINYVVYKRSTAKSRTGKVLFIRKDLYREMIDWSRMGISFDDEETDYVSLLAYESLVGSSLHDTIKIETENIFVVSDYISFFDQDVNLVSVDKDGILKNDPGMTTIEQNLFDGQSLLDESFYTGTEKSMLLLRQHMFKSAAFRCDVQQYLKDKAIEKGVDFDKWVLYDYFNNPVKASKILMITTPSSLKALKFSDKLGGDAKMYDHWCKTVEKEDYLFGIVKEEKSSKLGNDVQQLSYQMINSLPCSDEELNELAGYEIDYVDKLKNDMDAFMQYALDTADMTNSNEMMIALYKHNPNFAATKLFRTWKAKRINKYIERVKMGKLKIQDSDYCVLLGNPIEMLAHAVGDFQGTSLSLVSNQVHTKMFEPELTLTGFRNPHTSPSNVLSAVNKNNEIIRKYLPNLSRNIVAVNCIGFPLQDILSGSDYDSDSVLLTSNPLIAKIGERCKDYRVCISRVEANKTQYVVNNTNMCLIDETLSKSQKYIGQVTNVAQLLISNIWDAERKQKDCSKMWNKLANLTVLSGICIDLAKRVPKVDIKLQISDAKKVENMLDYKPYWWMVRNKDVAKGGNTKVKRMKDNDIPAFHCPMDFLYNAFTNLKYADKVKNIDIMTLLISKEKGKANNGQKHKIINILDDLAVNENKSYQKEVSKDEKEELIIERNELVSEAIESIKKLTMNDITMYTAITDAINANLDNNTIRSFGVLYRAQAKLFINAFRMK